MVNGDTSCSWIRRLDIVKMAILFKLIYRFNETPIRSPADFVKNDRQILKFVWNHKGSTIEKTILKKKNTVGELPISKLITNQ